MSKNKQKDNPAEEQENVEVKASVSDEKFTEEKPDSEDNKESATDDVSSEQKEIERLKIELSEAKDKYLRLYSEFDNYRRRSAKERLELVQSANQDLLQDLLPVLDDFERAGQNFSEKIDPAALKEGMDLISNKFSKILTQKGVKPMDVGEGSDFDPEIHEAITQIPAPKDDLKGKVVDVIEKGYYLHEKVIRYARVVIGN